MLYIGKTPISASNTEVSTVSLAINALSVVWYILILIFTIGWEFVGVTEAGEARPQLAKRRTLLSCMFRVLDLVASSFADAYATIYTASTPITP